MSEKSLEFEEEKYHYDMLRNNEDEIVDKLNLHLGFFSFRFKEKIRETEIIYDTSNNLLSNAGIVLSKQSTKNRNFFKVRKISYLPTEFKKPSKKIELADCRSNESPKDFALQVSTAINNSFSNVFTIDLAEVVKKTYPKIQIIIKGNVYEISGGTGFKGVMVFGRTIYKDLIAKKKVKRREVTLIMPTKGYEKDKADVLEGVEKYCKELIPYKESRFEIASRILFPKVNKHKLGLKNLKEEKDGDKQKEDN